MPAASVSSLLGPNPPKPNLTLRVGITGHRPKPAKFPPTSYGFVRRRLDEVFVAIDLSLSATAGNQRGPYSGERPRVRLVSALAEGADQLAVDSMPEGWVLDAVLPFPRGSYLKDFEQSAVGDGKNVTKGLLKCLDKATTVVELPADAAIDDKNLNPHTTPDEYWRRRNAGYVRCGAFLLRQIDLLVAVWDGQPEEGAGGTAAVVSAALDAEIPVFWVHSLQDAFARRIVDIDSDGRVDAPEADCQNGPLAEAIDGVVSLSAQTEDDGGPGLEKSGLLNVLERLTGFLNESWPRTSRWVTYDLFKRQNEGKSLRFKIEPDTEAGYSARWVALDGDSPAAGDLGEHMVKTLLPRYAWADTLAVHYSHRYRAAYFNCYLLAAFAVAIALLGIFGHEFAVKEQQLAFKAVLVMVELLAILTIVYVLHRGRTERWQEKWLEYRALAELLLNARFLAYLGEHGRAHRMGTLEPEPSAWFLWYLRATIREIGLPRARLDGTYQRQLLTAVDAHVIQDQRNWHRANAAALDHMHRNLHRYGDFCFIATGVLLFTFLLAWLAFVGATVVDSGKGLGDVLGLVHDGVSPENVSQNTDAASELRNWLLNLKEYVTYLAAFLPALGAAVAGIRETGDFERVSERSSKTAVALHELHREIDRAQRRLKIDETGDLLLSTARVLTEDLVAFQTVYGYKRLELPA